MSTAIPDVIRRLVLCETLPVEEAYETAKKIRAAQKNIDEAQEALRIDRLRFVERCPHPLEKVRFDYRVPVNNDLSFCCSLCESVISLEEGPVLEKKV